MNGEPAQGGRGRRPKLTEDGVVSALSKAGPTGLSFSELFRKLDKGSKTTLWKILKIMAREGLVERDLETAKYVLIHSARKERVIIVPVRLGPEMAKLADLAVSKDLATSRSDLLRDALADHLFLLGRDGSLGITNEELQRKLGAELGLAGHLAKVLMRVDRRLGQIEKRVGLVK